MSLRPHSWLIDPYWTLIPPLLGHLYQLHPNARFNEARSALALALLWVWSLRLSHNYFRREEWKFGQREDWRYTKVPPCRDTHIWSAWQQETPHKETPHPYP